MKDYRLARKRVSVSVGESVRIMRELQELSQNQLASLSGIPQTTISAIETLARSADGGRMDTDVVPVDRTGVVSLHEKSDHPPEP
ncbi:MAG: helix-turn-helix transcriptional regulator [Burkholderiales bacterium]|nr:helix-turn-helix transcriptional regulator [Burkholderiales bacterium]